MGQTGHNGDTVAWLVSRLLSVGVAVRSARTIGVVLSATLGLLASGGTTAAHAESLLGPEVRLAATAPRPGEVVSGIRTIAGTADAPEGIARVDLYVMSHQLTGTTRDKVPVATTQSDAPLSRIQFSFTWDSAKTVQGVVDVVVVATTPTTRTAEARVLSLQVRNVTAPVPQPTSAPRPAVHAAPAAPARPLPVAGPVATPPRTLGRAAPPALSMRVAGPAQAHRVPSPLVARAAADQAEAFYSALHSPVAVDAAPARVPSISAVSDVGRGYAPSLAVALVLLLAAAHTQRAVRVSLAPRD
jgi:hypothetical protein